MDENFDTKMDDLNLSTENLFKIFDKYEFPSPNILIFNDSLGYLDSVIEASKDFRYDRKLKAIKIRNFLNYKHLNILKNE